MDHTANRFYEALENNIKENVLSLHKHVFDGSRCHSIFNYKDIKNSSNKESYNESQLFTSFIYSIYNKSTHDSSLIWYNLHHYIVEH